MSDPDRLGASFRDPSGFLFRRDGGLYRQVNLSYRENYDALIGSGLYERLVRARLLIQHEEVDILPPEPNLAYKVIRPEKVDFISYPYEWSFSQLKDAALTTLAVQRQALKSGFTLKDSSAYNIQFHHGRSVLIDSLSFEQYKPGHPWEGYRQFCQHFLAPLALMGYRDVRLSRLLRVYIDGIPLDLASRLLPWRTYLSFGLLTHLHLHATLQKTTAPAPTSSPNRQRVSQVGLLGLIDSLEGTVKRLRWKPAGTTWGEYYESQSGHYSQMAFENKQQIVKQYMERIRPARAWDLGANTGVFSRITSKIGVLTVSFDFDPAAVEKNYRSVVGQKEESILPLVLDLNNPSPSLGWNHAERMSLVERGPVDAVLALALVHHLAISNNVPLGDISAFFSRLCRWLVIEFVPKEDPQVQILLASRRDIFADYAAPGFEAAFSQNFTILERQPLSDSPRTLYLMEKL